MLRYIYTIYALLLFVVIFLILLPFFFLFSFFKKGKQYSWYLLRAWAYIWFLLLGMRVRIQYQQKPRKDRPYIFIANHASFLDTPFIYRAFPCLVMPLATEAFSKIPLFGFLYRQMTILVNRKDEKSRRQSLLELKQTLLKGGNVLLFPEGGINESNKLLKSFYDGAFRLSKETGVSILPVIFPDTNKRWHPDSFWHWTPGQCRAIFLPTINPKQNTNARHLKQLAFDRMKEALKSIS